MSSFVKSGETPFAAGAGRPAPPARAEDPYAALDDLMAAVEALCPEWPARDRIIEGTFRL